MDGKIYTTKYYRNEIAKATAEEMELLRLLNVKAEKLCNSYLTKHQHTQLSYLTKEEQAGAVALPKRMILDKLLAYLKVI